jgi:imidazole glycerol phosphate synthase glutamine amidotransferase subunit
MADVAVVDYGAGNVASVVRALQHLGARAHLTDVPSEIAATAAVVFPGQGHFGQAMARLQATGLDRTLLGVIASGKPFFGICLGLQLLFDGSDEAPDVPGLGVLSGRCVAFQPPRKTPQIGWNAVLRRQLGTPLDAVADGSPFYFVHTFHAVARDPAYVAATADYEGAFTAAVAHGNLFALQCHPEKSGHVGLAVLADWLKRQ